MEDTLAIDILNALLGQFYSLDINVIIERIEELDYNTWEILANFEREQEVLSELIDYQYSYTNSFQHTRLPQKYRFDEFTVEGNMVSFIIKSPESDSFTFY